MEFLSHKTIGIDFLNNNDSKLCFAYKLTNDVYDISGNTTYVRNALFVSEYEVSVFEFFDKVLKVNNKYIKQEDVDFSNYKYLYIYDFTPKYRFIKNSNTDVYDYIIKGISCNSELNVYFQTCFKKVANISDGRFAIKYLNKVIFYDDDNIFLCFAGGNLDRKVSIINYNKEKLSSIDKLYEVIRNNRKIKDVLVKTTVNDIRSNYYRIGFKLYQEGIIDNSRNINEIVEENTRLIKRLSSLNSSIEEDVNRLINR